MSCIHNRQVIKKATYSALITALIGVENNFVH